MPQRKLWHLPPLPPGAPRPSLLPVPTLEAAGHHGRCTDNQCFNHFQGGHRVPHGQLWGCHFRQRSADLGFPNSERRYSRHRQSPRLSSSSQGARDAFVPFRCWRGLPGRRAGPRWARPGPTGVLGNMLAPCSRVSLCMGLGWRGGRGDPVTFLQVHRTWQRGRGPTLRTWGGRPGKPGGCARRPRGYQLTSLSSRVSPSLGL